MPFYDSKFRIGNGGGLLVQSFEFDDHDWIIKVYMFSDALKPINLQLVGVK